MTSEYGRRLIPSVLKLEAKQNPARIFAKHAVDDDLNGGFVDITFGQIARAVDHVSYWLESCFEGGKKPLPHTTIAYVGVPDIRYNIVFYAAIQCQYKVFLPSPRNPVAVNVSLLEQTQCIRLVHSIEVTPAAQALKSAATGLHCEQLSSLSELLAASSSEYPYGLDYYAARKDPVLVLHSSGSTGLPKPVVNTHGTLATYDVRDWPTVPGRVNHDGLSTLRFAEPESSIYDVFPPFHIAGFMTKIMVPVYNLTIVVFGPSLRPPSGALAAEIIRKTSPRGVLLPPTVAEQLYHEPDGSDLLTNIDVLLYGGGPLPQKIGDEISKHTTLCQFYGSTEASQIRQLIPLREHWSYFEFHPNESFEMQSAGDNLYELVLFANETLERTSSLYHNYPGLQEWRTKDLFVPHPTNEKLWKFYGRRDDILVFSSGEKLNPLVMETYVTGIQGVSGALVVGGGRAQAALLVELQPNAKFSSDPRHYLWPTVEEGNALLPAHGRIAKSLIVIAKREKPFERAGKGTVVRRLTEDLYTEEIEEAYKQHAQMAPAVPTFSFKPSTFGEPDVKGLIRSVLRLASIATENVADGDNFYSHGLDSMKTVELVGQLRSNMGPYRGSSDLKWISVELLYRHPTLDQLASVLLDFLNKGVIPRRRDRNVEMETTCAKLIDKIPIQPRALNGTVHCETFTVAVTGTTGFFGSFLLRELSTISQISRIYALNRSLSAQEIFQKRHPGNTATNIEFVHVDLNVPDLGLGKNKRREIQQTCNAIIHNAWRVDFNLSLSSFGDNLNSVIHIINLATESVFPTRIFFVSSISATGRWSPSGSPSKQTIPEAVVQDPSLPIKMGYAEAKYVAENILHAAGKRAGVPVTILRMGQIAPSTRVEDGDTWPVGDVMRVYLQTAKALGLLATDIVEDVDWVPVDWATRIVKEILLSTSQKTNGGEEEEEVYNIVNPNTQPWKTTQDVVRVWCSKETHHVSTREWVDALRETDDGNPATLERLPALRMMNVYELIAAQGPMHTYASDRLASASESFRKQPVVDGTLIRMWLERI